jgi:hypothetical protein
MKDRKTEALPGVIQALEQERQKYLERISELEKNNNQQSEELKIFKSAAAQLQNDNQQLNQIIHNKAEHTQTILKTLSETEQDLINTQQKVSDLSTQNNLLIHESQKSKSLIESLQSTAIKDKQEASDIIQKFEKKYNATISELQEEHNQELEALRQSNNEFSSKLEKKDKTILSQNSEIKVLNQYLTEMTQEYENLVEQFTESQISYSLQSRIDSIPWEKSQEIKVSRKSSTNDTESKDGKTLQDELDEISSNYNFSQFFSNKQYTLDQLKELFDSETDKKKRKTLGMALEALHPKNYAKVTLWQAKFDSSKSDLLEQNPNSNLPNPNSSNKPKGR